MPYSPLLIRPMREELTSAGFAELRTVEEVQSLLDEKQGTTLVVVNSVCGCAAGGARPGARLAIQESPRPDRLATVFAGQDLEATARCGRASARFRLRRRRWACSRTASSSGSCHATGSRAVTRWRWRPTCARRSRPIALRCRSRAELAGKLASTQRPSRSWEPFTTKSTNFTASPSSSRPPDPKSSSDAATTSSRRGSSCATPMSIAEGDPASAEKSRAEFLDHARRFGAWPNLKRILVPAESVREIRRLGEI